jgi:hypothetical protein
MVKQILESIGIYLSFVLQPRALVNVARDYQALSKQIAKTIDTTIQLNKEFADALARGHFDKPIVAASRNHEGGTV